MPKLTLPRAVIAGSILLALAWALRPSYVVLPYGEGASVSVVSVSPLGVSVRACELPASPFQDNPPELPARCGKVYR